MAISKTTRKRATRRRRTPARTKSKIDFMKALKNLKTPSLFVLGLLGGKKIGMFIDQNNTIKGIAGPDGKKLITPALQMLIGMTVPQLVKNEDLKIIGYGVAASGLVKAVNEVTGKKILDVLSGSSDEDLPVLIQESNNAQAIDVNDLDFEEVYSAPIADQAEAKSPNSESPISGSNSQMDAQYPSDTLDEDFDDSDDELDGVKLA